MGASGPKKIEFLLIHVLRYFNLSTNTYVSHGVLVNQRQYGSHMVIESPILTMQYINHPDDSPSGNLQLMSANLELRKTEPRELKSEQDDPGSIKPRRVKPKLMGPNSHVSNAVLAKDVSCVDGVVDRPFVRFAMRKGLQADSVNRKERPSKGAHVQTGRGEGTMFWCLYGKQCIYTVGSRFLFKVLVLHQTFPLDLTSSANIGMKMSTYQVGIWYIEIPLRIVNPSAI